MTIEDLIEKHHGERTFFDHELVGVYFTMQNLEAFTKQAVEDFKASLVPVGEVSGNDWSMGLLYQDSEPGTLLYSLGEKND